MFVGVLFYLISLYEKKPRLLWLTIPLFLVWADVDGEFILGYALFGLWVALVIFKQLWEKTVRHDNKLAKIKKDRHFYFEKAKLAIQEEKKEIIFLVSLLLGSFAATFINPFGYG